MGVEPLDAFDWRSKGECELCGGEWNVDVGICESGCPPPGAPPFTLPLEYGEYAEYGGV